MGFARSQARILSLEHAITRVALTNPGDTGRTSDPADGDEKAASGQMGRKHTIPYALYRAHGFISPFLAKDTGFNDTDYALLLEALTQMFEHDRSAARSEMAVRGLGVFEHESALGNAPAHRLLESLRVDGPESPRAFAEYTISAPKARPAGVHFRWIVDPHEHV
jgi:CRISPR-associated protein Csd2